ncbi:MAG: phosphotransferase [Bacteriovorax sp.]|jgi:aminoglycoside/choline kinase family phosphotransferase|nr:phosphotransferase [Bacteriovorax sp.]
MKPEQSERILVEELFKKTIKKNLLNDDVIENIEKLTGDASTRKYYRIWTSTTSYVVCLDTPLTDFAEEPSFVKLQKVLSGEKVRVPLIFDKDLGTGYLLEEDLGDSTFLKEISLISNIEEEFQFYKKAVDLMATIHNVDVRKYEDESFTKLAFDTEKLFAEMEFTKKYFLKMYLGLDVESIGVEKLYKKLYSMCEMLSGQPRVLVHRDYHSRNLMIKNKEQVVIDFQDARMGTPLYDLVSLLEDCYYQINEENKQKLIDYYFNSYYQKIDSSKNFQDYKYVYDMMAIQRVFKAIGSFAYIYADRKDLRYVKYIGYAFEKVRSLMLRHEYFSEERKILSSLYYAN